MLGRDAREFRETRVPLPATLTLPVLLAAVAVAHLGPGGYLPVHLNFPGLPTSLTSTVLHAVAGLSAAYCLGSWTYAACIVPRRRGQGTLALGGRGQLTGAFWAALTWAVAATCLIPVDAADAAGEHISALARPGAFTYLVQANYLPRAWIVAAACAWAITVITLLTTAWETIAVVALLGATGVLAPVVVTQVLVGPNHDYGSDCAIIGTPAFMLLVGVVLAHCHDRSKRHDRPTTQRRLRLTVGGAAAVVVATDLVIGWFEIAGHSPLDSATGRLLIAKDALVVVAAALIAARPAARPRAAYAGCLLLLVAQALALVSFRIPPPQYFVPTTIPQNFFGFAVSKAPDALTLLTDWRLNILFAAAGVAAIATYLAGVRRLHHRGQAWPMQRTVTWCSGWLVVIVCTSSGVGRYAGASFSVHMAFHMAVNMLGPLLMVLGGPITLALQATTAHRANQPHGPHEWLTAFVESAWMRWIYNPLEVFAVFIGSYFALYLTPLFQDSLRFHWAHQLAYVHFVFIGYLFYGLAIGVDAPPRSLPHLGKLGMILAAMPFHAFFGVMIMTHHGVIGQTFYRYLAEPWMTDLSHDQYIGGEIAWGAGELPLIVVIVALILQWSRQDARQAKAVGRRLGTDPEQTAYHEMLMHLESHHVGSDHDHD